MGLPSPRKSASVRAGKTRRGEIVKDLLCDEFQEAVDNYLIRHRSILDVITKLQESNARVTRAAMKAVTTCGCLQLHATKPKIPLDITLDELRDYMSTHLEGELCDICREVLEDEMGRHLFFLVALSNHFGLNFQDTIAKEHKKLKALGVFSAS